MFKQTHTDNDSFGEITQKPMMRDGTCEAESDLVQCLEIQKDQYLLKVKKVNQDRLNKQSKFLK